MKKCLTQDKMRFFFALLKIILYALNPTHDVWRKDTVRRVRFACFIRCTIQCSLRLHMYNSLQPRNIFSGAFRKQSPMLQENGVGVGWLSGSWNAAKKVKTYPSITVIPSLEKKLNIYPRGLIVESITNTAAEVSSQGIFSLPLGISRTFWFYPALSKPRNFLLKIIHCPVENNRKKWRLRHF